MTLEDTCDVANCTLLPAKKILFKGLGLSPFSEHRMEICGKHYLEFLTLMWDRSKAKALSEEKSK